MEKGLGLPKGLTVGKAVKILESVFGKLEWKSEHIGVHTPELPREQIYENSSGTKIILQYPIEKNFAGGFYLESQEPSKRLINYGLKLARVI